MITPAASIDQAARASSTCSIMASDDHAIVETTSGKVRGYSHYGICTFKGIPYGDTTEGPARFLPCRPAKPWAGVRSTMAYGPFCPQRPRARWTNDMWAWLWGGSDGRPGEDCLCLNVWTPGINDHGKRAVMVWIHGGGYTGGSSQDLAAYDGERLSRRGDVVVVSVDHRLGILGYMDLAELGGSRYASSGNVGNLDLVAALAWVRENIAAFGGDPANVTIFGWSGGGAKIAALMAMPSAHGLFHRAIVQSGSALGAASREHTIRLAAAAMGELGLRPRAVELLHHVPVERLVEAATAAQRKLYGDAPLGASYGLSWEAVVDGSVLPHEPFRPIAPAISAGIPMLIGTVLNEFSPSLIDPAAEHMTEEDLRTKVSLRYSDTADEILAVYGSAHPTARPVELLSRIFSAPKRSKAIAQADLKTSPGAAPVYLYQFSWQPPVFGGRLRAFHGSDLPFVFDNTDRCDHMTGGSEDARRLAVQVSGAWIQFARVGNPNHRGLPAWPAYRSDTGAAMVFDRVCAVRHDHDRREREIVAREW